MNPADSTPLTRLSSLTAYAYAHHDQGAKNVVDHNFSWTDERGHWHPVWVNEQPVWKNEKGDLWFVCAECTSSGLLEPQNSQFLDDAFLCTNCIEDAQMDARLSTGTSDDQARRHLHLVGTD